MLNVLEFLLEPLTLALSLWMVAIAHTGGYLAPRYMLLSLAVFAVTFPGPAYLTQTPVSVIRNILANWITISGLLFLLCYASGYLRYFDADVLITWWWIAPLGAVGTHFMFRGITPQIIKLQGNERRAIIAGMNDQGIELARRLGADPYSHIQVLGFFDDRSTDRINQSPDQVLLGRITSLAAYVKLNQVDAIYISLPMASQPRILSLLEDLRDTTASIYFVPDIFVTDLIQGRMDTVSGLPVVAVCETPFTGLNGVLKRGSDILISLLLLVLTSPVLLCVAAGIKLTSPGPVIFRQRRYGLDGREIVVYKFRSMRVAEDGPVIPQAQKNDPRITPLGRFLRRTSLDEFPQFINVLQGRMSIVGPRPHAVAHNEMYRKMIRGYMLRHKVKPGITGWAQVNGSRGETRTLDKMTERINYDLDYLRNWSLRLDLYIIARTMWVVLMERDNAY
ncbi:MAG TPA: undecaprenyl-phosphate glucose phosphotransferase [Rhodocyclaceae bacterium]|nr:undecaprenyl-phosphate glucose phosphotransferase [Rhodocyclaceae bacterium]